MPSIGRALADAGRYQQALEVLSKAHTPDQPDWRLLNAQGAVLDQMGNFAEARSYYETALKIAPDEPAILSNLGLSYMLAKDLPRAEATLKRATARTDADPRVRQNLALVLGLQGKFDEAEKSCRGRPSARRGPRQCRVSARNVEAARPDKVDRRAEKAEARLIPSFRSE